MDCSYIKFYYHLRSLHKFLSHRSRTRLIKLALKRAAVPVKYTAGFNPRISIIYCPPSPVGVSVENDFFIILSSLVDFEKDVINKINETLPVGFRIHNIERVDKEEVDKISKDIVAVYNITFLKKIESIEQSIEDVISQKELILKRKGKKDKNIRLFINKLICCKDDKGNDVIKGFLKASQESYLSPIDFLKIFLQKEKEEFLYFTEISRIHFELEKGK